MLVCDPTKRLRAAGVLDEIRRQGWGRFLSLSVSADPGRGRHGAVPTAHGAFTGADRRLSGAFLCASADKANELSRRPTSGAAGSWRSQPAAPAADPATAPPVPPKPGSATASPTATALPTPPTPATAAKPPLVPSATKPPPVAAKPVALAGPKPEAPASGKPEPSAGPKPEAPPPPLNAPTPAIRASEFPADPTASTPDARRTLVTMSSSGSSVSLTPSASGAALAVPTDGAPATKPRTLSQSTSAVPVTSNLRLDVAALGQVRRCCWPPRLMFGACHSLISSFLLNRSPVLLRLARPPPCPKPRFHRAHRPARNLASAAPTTLPETSHLPLPPSCHVSCQLRSCQHACS